MNENDIEVVLADDRLTIKGEKKAESEKKEDDFHLVERSYGSFERTFRLSVRSGRGMGPVKRISHVEARPHKVLSFCW